MARKFLYVIAALVVLVLAALLALRFWAGELSALAFVPTAEFAPQPHLPANAYDEPAMWISRPGLGDNDPARWLPEGFTPDGEKLDAAVFFIHPTSYLDKERWNAPLDDPGSRELATTFVRGMASPFNASEQLWAPRYRQATFGAFLTDAPQARQALDLAYEDVREAFDRFAASVDPDRPIVLAGHSQGAYLLRRLMKERVAGTPLAGRIAAVYAIGWPVSLEHDLPAMGLPACTGPDQPGCIVSWASFAEPAEPALFLEGYAHRHGIDGKLLDGSRFLCSNPLTGRAGGTADAGANLGTLIPDLENQSGRLVPGMVPARCDDRGLLLIGEPPDLGPYVLPGNNYHVYDIVLFWRNLREDVARRVKAWQPG